ncbi:hypothetical protein [Candidatus Marithrix sp. Canyon 246]|uniref:hypothetical protein n=1 Tax=Candidatus Marithrix sp. Canyon 246 TaxID=1827136 RepID=UPI00084A1F25|nr:hypothetical protein [Candidatus Marithrix sp. Canyon 246]
MNNKLKSIAMSASLFAIAGIGSNAWSSSAIYTTITGNLAKSAEIDFDKIMIEIYDPLTDDSTGEYAVYHAPHNHEFSPQPGYKSGNFTFDVLPGFRDVRISPQSFDALGHTNTVDVVTIVPQDNDCSRCQTQLSVPVCVAGQIGTSLTTGLSRDTYIPAYSEQQETLCLPSVLLEKWAVLPGGINKRLPSDCYKMSLDTATTQAGVLKINKKVKITCPTP